MQTEHRIENNKSSSLISASIFKMLKKFNIFVMTHYLLKLIENDAEVIDCTKKLFV